MSKALALNGFETLNNEELLAVDGGGKLGSIFNGVADAINTFTDTVNVGPIAQNVAEIGIDVVTFPGKLCDLYGW
jgi:hypothetical protein